MYIGVITHLLTIDPIFLGHPSTRSLATSKNCVTSLGWNRILAAWRRPTAIATAIDGRHPAITTLDVYSVNDGLTYLSTGVGCLPSTIWYHKFAVWGFLSKVDLGNESGWCMRDYNIVGPRCIQIRSLARSSCTVRFVHRITSQKLTVLPWNRPFAQKEAGLSPNSNLSVAIAVSFRDCTRWAPSSYTPL